MTDAARARTLVWLRERGARDQESRIWRRFLAYDYAYEGAVRVASVMACHASKEARGIIRGASLWCVCVRMPGLAFLLRGVLSLVQR